MSASLTRRLEALEAKAPGAIPSTFLTFEPYGASPAVLEAFHADIAARQAANPRLNVTICRWVNGEG